MGIIISIIPFTIGACIVVNVIKTILRDRKIESWPQVGGEVKWSMVTHTEKRGRNGRMESLYEHTIEYEYEIGEIIYSGDKIGLADMSTGYEYYARKSVDRFPAGKLVDVIYNPNKPEESYLDKDVSKVTYVILILSSIFCITLGVVMLITGGDFNHF